MARRAPQPTISPKMLKHFAVATAALTACLALFADGEGRNELGQSVVQRERDAAAAVAAAGEKVKPKFSLNTQIRDARRTYVPLAGEDGDSGGAYGAPMDSAAGSSGGSSISSGSGARPQFLPGPSGLDPAQSAMARGGQQIVAGDRGRAGPVAPRRPSREEIARLEAQSLARSGSRTTN